MPRPKPKMCSMCDKQDPAKHSRYCLRCSKFAPRLKYLTHKAAKAVREYIRTIGFVCFYTGMVLDLDDPHSPWYCVFDHWAPHDPRKIVLTSSLINAMKSDLSEKEFWYYIRALANFRRLHIAVKKIKLTFWDRDYTLEDGIDLSQQAYGSDGAGVCYMCGKKLSSNYQKYCPTCAELVHRLKNESRHYKPESIEDIRCYLHQYGFICYFTKMPLNTANPRSPWYCVLNHLNPNDPQRKAVISSALVNALKAGLSEKDFWYYILQLADYKGKGKAIVKKEPASWNRLYPVDDVRP